MVFILFVGVVFTSCEREINRIHLDKTNVGTISFNMKKGDEVKIQTEIDVEYSEEPLIVYDFEGYIGDSILFKGGVDPFQTTPKINEIKTTKNGLTSWKFTGDFGYGYKAREDTIHSFQLILIKNAKSDVNIKKADVIFIKPAFSFKTFARRVYNRLKKSI